MNKKSFVLNDVMIMRPIVILLLVFMHSFTMYSGGAWSLPQGISPIHAYDWLTKITFSFMLEAFVFISGYLLCSQLKRKDYPFFPFVTKKAKRLILPSILFSILYFLAFGTYQTFGRSIVSILEGCGHMWYLPMIFWSFIMGYLLYSLKMPSWSKLFACFILSSLSGFTKFLPLQLDKACYYIFFFYLGMFMLEYKETILKRIKNSHIIMLVISYIVTFVCLTIFVQYTKEAAITSVYLKAGRIILLQLAKIIYSTQGLLAFYLLINRALSGNLEFAPPIWLIWLNSISFGVYIYQQFILKWLYYHTDLPQITGSYILPWVGFLVTLAVSMLLSTLTIKTKIGRFFIG